MNVGDKVVVSNRYREYIDAVVRITPTGRVRVGNSYYDKYGSQIGGDVWNRCYIKLATEEDEKTIIENDFSLGVSTKMRNFRNVLRYEDAIKIDGILKTYNIGGIK